MICFIDIDGTLADCTHRLKYLEKKNYEKFYSDTEILKDTRILAGLEFAEALMNDDFSEFYLLTGRPYRTEKATRTWLRLQHYYELSKVPIFMRHDHDYRPASVIKTEILQKFIEHEKPEDTILFVDDDPRNVAAVESAVENCIGILFGTQRLDLN